MSTSNTFTQTYTHAELQAKINALLHSKMTEGMLIAARIVAAIGGKLPTFLPKEQTSPDQSKGDGETPDEQSYNANPEKQGCINIRERILQGKKAYDIMSESTQHNAIAGTIGSVRDAEIRSNPSSSNTSQTITRQEIIRAERARSKTHHAWDNIDDSDTDDTEVDDVPTTETKINPAPAATTDQPPVPAQPVPSDDSTKAKTTTTTRRHVNRVTLRRPPPSRFNFEFMPDCEDKVPRLQQAKAANHQQDNVWALTIRMAIFLFDAPEYHVPAGTSDTQTILIAQNIWLLCYNRNIDFNGKRGQIRVHSTLPTRVYDLLALVAAVDAEFSKTFKQSMAEHNLTDAKTGFLILSNITEQTARQATANLMVAMRASVCSMPLAPTTTPQLIFALVKSANESLTAALLAACPTLTATAATVVARTVTRHMGEHLFGSQSPLYAFVNQLRTTDNFDFDASDAIAKLDSLTTAMTSERNQFFNFDRASTKASPAPTTTGSYSSAAQRTAQSDTVNTPTHADVSTTNDYTSSKAATTAASNAQPATSAGASTTSNTPATNTGRSNKRTTSRRAPRVTRTKPFVSRSGVTHSSQDSCMSNTIASLMDATKTTVLTKTLLDMAMHESLLRINAGFEVVDFVNGRYFPRQFPAEKRSAHVKLLKNNKFYNNDTPPVLESHTPNSRYFPTATPPARRLLSTASIENMLHDLDSSNRQLRRAYDAMLAERNHSTEPSAAPPAPTQESKTATLGPSIPTESKAATHEAASSAIVGSGSSLVSTSTAIPVTPTDPTTSGTWTHPANPAHSRNLELRVQNEMQNQRVRRMLEKDQEAKQQNDILLRRAQDAERQIADLEMNTAAADLELQNMQDHAFEQEQRNNALRTEILLMQNQSQHESKTARRTHVNGSTLVAHAHAPRRDEGFWLQHMAADDKKTVYIYNPVTNAISFDRTIYDSQSPEQRARQRTYHDSHAGQNDSLHHASRAFQRLESCKRRTTVPTTADLSTEGQANTAALSTDATPTDTTALGAEEPSTTAHKAVKSPTSTDVPSSKHVNKK